MMLQSATPRVNLALKITNWCNLNCAHCCERSHIKEPFKLMPVDKIERYISEFKDMGVPVWDYVTFTGGEVMAPTYIGHTKYIPTVADICARNDMSACFKTNGLWGNRLMKCDTVLKSLSDVAHKYDRQISLDISIDEYHNNLDAAANIVQQVMKSQYLIDAIIISFIGLNTIESQYTFNEFSNILRNRGFFVGSIDSDGTIMISKDNKSNVMFYDIGALSRLGRAADNNLTQHIPSSHIRSGDSDCLEITNNNQAILNYAFTTDIKDKTIAQVYNELKQKKR